eukprot:8473217-Alexandrium_andersonii.AAC.1
MPGGRSLRPKERGGRGDVLQVREHREANEHLAHLRRFADGLGHVVWRRACADGRDNGHAHRL